MLKKFNLKYYVCVVLLCFFSSCRKAKKEEHSYMISFYPYNSQIPTYQLKLKIGEYNKHRLVVTDLSSYASMIYGIPQSIFDIHKKSISGTFLHYTHLSTHEVDSMRINLNGEATAKKISGTYQDVLPPHLVPVYQPSNGTFEIDLTKPVE